MDRNERSPTPFPERVTLRDSPRSSYDGSSSSTRSVEETGLCRDCEVLEFDETEHGGFKLETADGGEFLAFRQITAPNGLELRSSISLPDGLNPGCQFCTFLRRAVLCFFGSSDWIEEVQISYIWSGRRLRMLKVDCTVWSPSRVQSYGKTSNAPPPLYFDVVAYPGPCATWLGIEREPLDQPAGSHLTHETISIIKKWVYENGNLELENRSSIRPTRLIDVRFERNAASCRLVETEQLPKSGVLWYAALSHCWGDPSVATPPLKTTARTIRTWQQGGIPDSLMPKTFLDAVKVARHLRIRYLWIDSLCIIQDDTSDWERESQKMAEIYQNAFVTIIPLAATSCHDGFLPPAREQPIKVSYASRLNPNARGHYYLRARRPPPGASTKTSGLRMSCKKFEYELDKSAWNYRGWTFQEDRYSTRRLYFGVHNLFFASSGQIWGDDAPSHPEPDEHVAASLASLVLQQPAGDFTTHSYGQLWYRQIEDYSGLDLTFAADRLPAISSLAKAVAARARDTYLAGLWAGDLHRGLLWSLPRRTAEAELRARVDGGTAAERFVAPSWSWARSRAAAAWGRWLVGLHAPAVAARALGPQRECVVLRAWAAVDGLNAFGRVRGGCVVVRGVVRRLAETRPRAVGLGGATFYKARLGGRAVADCWPDWEVEGGGGRWMTEFPRARVEGLLMLLVYTDPSVARGSTPRRFGLLLLPALEPGQFWRVGMFLTYGDVFFERAEERTVEII